MNTITYYDERFGMAYTVLFDSTHVLSVERNYNGHIEDLHYDLLPSSIKHELAQLICSHPSRRSQQS